MIAQRDRLYMQIRANDSALRTFAYTQLDA